MREAKIGHVLGTDAVTPTDFWIVADLEKDIQLDDVVKTVCTVNGKEIKFYGIVDEVRRGVEGIELISDAYRIKDVFAEEYHIAHVKTIKVEPEYYVAPKPGGEVFLVEGEEFYKVIGFSEGEGKFIPLGVTHRGDILWMDVEWVDGTKGAHVFVSGVSGLATKTSYCLFLLFNIIKRIDKDWTAVIFNVKGEDLMHIDKPNNRISSEDLKIWKRIFEGMKSRDDKEMSFQEIVVKAQGFHDAIEFFAPPHPSNPSEPYILQRGYGETKVLRWSFEQFCEEKLLPYLLGEESNENVLFLAYEIADVLEKDKGHQVKKLEDILKDIDGLLGNLGGSIASQTKLAFIRRIKMALEDFGGIGVKNLIASAGEIGISEFGLESRKVYVINIEPLSPRAQNFVVGSILRRIFREQSQAGGGRRKVFVMLDELNKYAPRDGNSPLKSILRDIAERGRSLGVILIGAAQSAKYVDEKIVLNASVKVVGRSSAGEIESDVYNFLPQTAKKRAMTLQPGKLFVFQPSLPIPILVRFPMPLWATRKEETVGEWSDGKEERTEDILPLDDEFL